MNTITATATKTDDPKAPANGTITGDVFPLATAFLFASGWGWLRPHEDPIAEIERCAREARESEFEWNVQVWRNVATGQIEARWDGVFTAGRWVELSIHPNGRAVLSWDSGTGESSAHIGRALKFVDSEAGTAPVQGGQD